MSAENTCPNKNIQAYLPEQQTQEMEVLKHRHQVGDDVETDIRALVLQLTEEQRQQVLDRAGIEQQYKLDTPMQENNCLELPHMSN